MECCIFIELHVQTSGCDPEGYMCLTWVGVTLGKKERRVWARWVWGRVFQGTGGRVFWGTDGCVFQETWGCVFQGTGGCVWVWLRELNKMAVTSIYAVKDTPICTLTPACHAEVQPEWRVTWPCCYIQLSHECASVWGLFSSAVGSSEGQGHRRKTECVCDYTFVVNLYT